MSPREDLRLGRLLVVWAPLAATFLLLTGATPVINASINRLPGRDHTADLAAFAVIVQILIALHSPLFVVREIAIKLSTDSDGSRRALRFSLGAGAVVAAIELLLGATDVGDWVVRTFTDASAPPGTHRAFLLTFPVPLMIAVRGVYQAHQIRVDDTLFVGLGTLARLVLTGVLGLLIAPHIGISGPMLGAAAFTLGILAETVFAVVRARAAARPPATSDAQPISVFRFGLPLMFANFIGVAAGLYYLRIAGLVPAAVQKASVAAFQETKSLHWLLNAGVFALQSFTTAKVRAPEDVKPMMRFAALVGAGLSLLFALIVFTPLRDWFLVGLMNEEAGGLVVQFAWPALALAVAMPLLNSLRFSLRGVLISRGHSAAITITSVITLTMLTAALVFEWLPERENGAWNAYVWWIGALLLELVVLGYLTVGRGAGGGVLPAPRRTAREAAAG